MVSVDGGSSASYAYDHQNRRYKATIGSTVTHYIWQGSQVIAEHNGSTGAVNINYIYAGSRMILSGAYYSLNDQLSARLILNSSGAVKGRQGHLAFGEDFGETGPQQEKHHFTSYERDSQTGTDYATNRNYSFVAGRFNSADPFQQSGGTTAPPTWNRYAYVVNAAIDFADPLGLLLAPPRPADTCGGGPGSSCSASSFSGEDPSCTGDGEGGDPPTCPADKRRFFDWLVKPLRKMAQDLNTTLALLLTQAAKEGGWDTKSLNHNQPINNPWGINIIKRRRPVGNRHFPSLDASIVYWERTYGDRVRGTQTPEAFGHGMQHPAHGYPYNSNPAYEADYVERYSDVLRYMALCEVQQ